MSQTMIRFVVTEDRLNGAIRDIIDYCHDHNSRIQSSRIEKIFELWEMLPKTNYYGYHERKQGIMSKIRTRLRKRQLALDLAWRGSDHIFALRAYNDSLHNKIYIVPINAKNRNEVLINQLKKLSEEELIGINFNPKKMLEVRTFLDKQTKLLVDLWQNSIDTAKAM